MKHNPEFEASEHSHERPAWKDFAQKIFEGGQAAERAKILEMLNRKAHAMNDNGYYQAVFDLEEYDKAVKADQ